MIFEVPQCPACISRRAFTLVELLVVIAIVALLAGLIFPAISKAREKAQIAKSASNMRQIYQAFVMYTGDNQDQCFWRSTNIATEGMDWFVHGGQVSNNHYSGPQGNLFNLYQPRPLNEYVKDNIEIFKHPSDTKPNTNIGNMTHYEWVGNDYAFNSMGYPGLWDSGLSGEFLSEVPDPSKTILFLEAHLLINGLQWAGGNKGNMIMLDGRLVFGPLPSNSDGRYSWGIK